MPAAPIWRYLTSVAAALTLGITTAPANDPARALVVHPDTLPPISLTPAPAAATTGARVWHGAVAGEPRSAAIVVTRDNVVFGVARLADGHSFALRGALDGPVTASPLDPALATCGLSHAAPPEAPGGGSPGVGHRCDDGSRIDVLVVYTAQARQAAGGTPQILAEIDLALADTNAAFARSNINTSVHLVHAQEVAYAESGVWTIDAPRLVDPNDGILDEVHALRNAHGADCVSLWVEQLDTGGIGFFPDSSLTGIGNSGFSMLRRANAPLLTMAHEFGHNLFAAHDRPNASDVPWAEYAYGYVEPGSQWQTIMAVTGIATIPHFANPAVNWPGPVPPNPGPTGVAAGNPAPCDVARTINETAGIVANFRPTASTPAGNVLRVDAAAPPGGDGASWATAIDGLQEALCIAAGANGTVGQIWVKAGVYTPDAGGDRDASFGLVSGVEILGGFAGGETSAAQRDPNAHLTQLSGEIGSPGTSADNSYHVVDGSGRPATAVLDGFLISDGFADRDPNADGGGGIRVFGSGAPTIRNCRIENNAGYRGGGVGLAFGGSATLEHCLLRFNYSLGSAWPAGGGGMHAYAGSSPTLRHCSFEANSATLGGGAALLFDCHATFEACVFTDNGDDAGDAAGGGLYAYGNCDATLTRCVFTGNDARYGMGLAMYFDCDPLLSDCRFSGHDRPADAEGGGAYFYANCSPTIESSLFSDNHTQFAGGLICLFGGAPDVYATTFRGNSATGDGGAASFYSDVAARLVNCVFSGNAAPFGGALGNTFSSHTEMINCTLAANSASLAGGGVYSYESDPVFANTILWGNTVGPATDESAQLDGFTSNPALSHCTVQGWSGALGGTANDGADPLLRDSDGADNVPGTADDDPRLSAGSPAIDTASDALLPPGVTTDVLGRARILGTQLDRGAYEFGATPGDINQDGLTDASDLAALWTCLRGPDLPPAAAPPFSAADCLAAFDHDADGDVDLHDLAGLQVAFVE